MSTPTALEVLQNLFVNTSLLSDVLKAKAGDNPQGWDEETISEIEWAGDALNRILAENRKP